jgi:tetratricopeptide (TPR) repeat protein
MSRRCWYFLPLLLCALPRAASGQPKQPTTPAQQAWALGQQAMEREEFEAAIGQFQLSLRLDPALVQNHLSLAAAYLARSEDERAVGHLARYVTARPAHLIARAHLAEVLLRLERPEEAREQFERFIADVQDHPRLASEHLVHCHSRLMEIAQRAGDDYAEHLHRGIGLYRLARKRAALAGSGGLSAEALLFQAAAELVLARRERPDEARPCWYLYQVWTQLAQQQPAMRWLRATEGLAPFSELTAAEKRDLHLACQHRLTAFRK